MVNYDLELKMNQGDRSEFSYLQKQINDLRTKYTSMQDYIQKNTNFQAQAQATGDVEPLL